MTDYMKSLIFKRNGIKKMANIFDIALEEEKEETVVAEAPVEETPVEAPAEEPAAETPVEEQAVEETPAEEAPAEVSTDAPVEEQEQVTEISIEELSNEIDRQEELSEGLVALRTIAERVETPTPNDVALFRVAANLAVAGTDESAEDFIPAIESNKAINTKAFDEKIKAIKNKIAGLQADLAALVAKKKLG
jgi:ribosomal protein S17E